MKLDQRIHLLDQLDTAPTLAPARPITAEAEDLAAWATAQLGRPVPASHVQAILDQPPVPVAQTDASLSVQGEVLMPMDQVKKMGILGGALVIAGLTVATQHLLGGFSYVAYAIMGPVGGVMLGKALRGWFELRTARAAEATTAN